MSKASLELGGTNWAAKDGNLLGYANGSFVDRYVPREFTFSRGSNLAATRINSAGKIEKGRENLLTYSNTFSSWSVLQITRTSGQSGYDGSNDAWLLTDTATSGDHRLYLANSHSGVNTLSVYAKAGTKSIVYVQSYINNSSIAYFDLSAGSVLSTAVGIDSKIESVGNGWYRCSMAFNNTNTYVTIGIAESATRSYVGDGTGTIYIQDAQLEVGLVATDYIESGATTATAGLLENEPRIDYTDGTPSLLLEPQRVNLVTQSEYFDGTHWSKQNAILVNTNSHTSPEGIQNATELDGFDSSNFQSISQYITTDAGAYTLSVFLKKTTGALTHYPAVVMGSVYKYVIINSTTGTYAEATGTNDNDYVKIQNWNDDWWRVIVTNTISAGSQRFAIYPSLSANGTTLSLSATGTNVFYGAQFEAGSYPTSYIPNHSGGSVTRTAESFSATGFADYLGDSEGTIFIEGEMSQKNGYISLIEGTNSGVSIGVNGGGQFFYIIRDSGSTQGEIAVSNIFTTNTNFKIAGKYKTNDFELFKDGASIGTDTTGNTFGDGDLITINSNSVFPADQPFYGRIKQILVFPTALSDDDCITLTT